MKHDAAIAPQRAVFAGNRTPAVYFPANSASPAHALHLVLTQRHLLGPARLEQQIQFIGSAADEYTGHDAWSKTICYLPRP
jgi:hypothetical protein